MRKTICRAVITGCVLTLAGTALAQQAPAPMRVRGQIEKVDGNTLTVKARDGATMAIGVPDNVRVTSLVKLRSPTSSRTPTSASPRCRSPTGARKRSRSTSSPRRARHRRRSPAVGSAAGHDYDQRGGRDDGRERGRAGADRQIQVGRQDRGEEGGRAARCRDRRLSAGREE